MNPRWLISPLLNILWNTLFNPWTGFVRYIYLQMCIFRGRFVSNTYLVAVKDLSKNILVNANQIVYKYNKKNVYH